MAEVLVFSWAGLWADPVEVLLFFWIRFVQLVRNTVYSPDEKYPENMVKRMPMSGNYPLVDHIPVLSI